MAAPQMRYGGRGSEFGFDSQSHDVPTPGPGRAVLAHQKLIVQLVGYLNRRDARPETLAAAMLTQPPEIQEQFSKLVFAMIADWAEFGEYTQPSNPLAHVYDTAKKMVNNLFR